MREAGSDVSASVSDGLWSKFVAALRGTHGDYTKGPVGPAIFALAVPMVLEMLMESVFAVADVFFVGKLGAYAVATVGLTESMLTMVYTVAMGLSIGTGAMVARRVGENDHEGAAKVGAQALLLGAFVSVVLGVLGAIFAADLLGLMGASAEIVEKGTPYARIMLGGNAAILLLFLANSIFRGAGDGVIAMRSLWLANAVNLVLAPGLIFGIGPLPELGLTGAAVGTTIGRGVGVVFSVSHLFKQGSRVRVRAAMFRYAGGIIASIVRLSASATIQTFIGMASWVGLVRLVATFGSEATAGYTIGLRVVMFALLPSFGMSNAAATMVGQALGAKNPERAEQAVWLTAFYNVIFLGIIGLCFVLFPSFIVGQFTTDAQTLAYGADALRIVAAGFLFYAYGMVITQAFNGAGDTATPTWINLFVFWVFEIPLAYLLAVVFGMGPRGVFVAMAVAFSALAVVAAILFKRGNWKTRTV